MDRSVSSGAVTERRPLRIVVFHLGFFYSGGGERLVLEQVRWLRERGHSVEVFAPIVDPVKCFPELIAEVHPRELLRRAPDFFGVGDGLTLIASAVRARGLTKGLVADVYLGANQPGAWLARAAARQHGRRYVVYFSQPNRLLLPRAIDRDTSSKVIRRDFYLLSAAANLGRPLLDTFDRQSVSDASVRLGDGAYITTILRFYYGGSWRNCPAATVTMTDAPPDHASRQVACVRLDGLEISGPFILLTNRHYPQKRFEDMFPVLEHVRARVPEATLVITGAETSYTGQLRREVEQRGLERAVHFLGLVPESILEQLYRAASVYVYPSPEEDFGMGIVEAMARGAPVVAWDNAGPSMIIEDGRTGRLAPLGDVSAFADAVLELLLDGERADALSRAAVVAAETRFSQRAHTEILEQALYDAAT